MPASPVARGIASSQVEWQAYTAVCALQPVPLPELLAVTAPRGLQVPKESKESKVRQALLEVMAVMAVTAPRGRQVPKESKESKESKALQALQARQAPLETMETMETMAVTGVMAARVRQVHQEKLAVLVYTLW